MSKYIKRKVKVNGRVQGVGFRSFVFKLGKSLGISGWVKNNADGTVSIEASGLDERVKKFYGEVQVGSFFSRVDQMEILESISIDEQPDSDFIITY